MKPKVLIVGCGYVGLSLGQVLQPDCEVWGLRRSPVASGIPIIVADLAKAESALVIPEQLDFIVYLVSADQRNIDSYQLAYVECLKNLLAVVVKTSPNLKRLIYVSSTAVYGQNDGGWVDESSATEPLEFSGRILLSGESLARDCGLPATVLRLGGIYGPGRDRLLQMVSKGAAEFDRNFPVFTNRIHRDDCALSLRHLIFNSMPDDVYLGVDNRPSCQEEVYLELARLLGVAEPKSVSWSLEQRTQRGQGKRCNNQRLKNSGYIFKYPSFSEGYADLLAKSLVAE